MFLSFSLRDMPEISLLLRIDHYKQARNTFLIARVPGIIPSMKTRAIEDLPFCEIFENSLKQQSPMKGWSNERIFEYITRSINP